MMRLTIPNAVRVVSILMLTSLCACSTERDDASGGPRDHQREGKLTKAEKREARAFASRAGAADSAAEVSTTDASRFAATDCDPSMWNHVWEPTRLQQLQACITVSGTVQESTPDEDGDQHFLLQLDPEQKGLVNKRNEKKKNGALVVEIVCANPVQVKKAKAACAGYTDRITVPQAGWRVKVTGTYVIDTHNGWAELHPVSRLERM